jgi:hypothetical protein
MTTSKDSVIQESGLTANDRAEKHKTSIRWFEAGAKKILVVIGGLEPPTPAL